MEIDEIDKQIISVLKEHARWSVQKISKKTSIPITTVHNRLKKLEKNDIIQGYTAIFNHEKLGNSITAYVLLKGDLSYLQSEKMSPYTIINNLKKNESVEEINSTTGHYDYVIKVRVKNMTALSQMLVSQIRRIPGLHSTETLIVLNE